MVPLSRPHIIEVVSHERGRSGSTPSRSNAQLFGLHQDELVALSGRLIPAYMQGVKSACQGFISTVAVITPVGMLWHIKHIRTPKVWAGKGYVMGRDWGRTSAFFLGGEVFAEKIRNKKDRWNSYVGSGLGSAALRMDEGPMGMVNGFIFGFGFLYIFDVFGAGAGKSGSTHS